MRLNALSELWFGEKEAGGRASRQTVRAYRNTNRRTV